MLRPTRRWSTSRQWWFRCHSTSMRPIQRELQARTRRRPERGGGTKSYDNDNRYQLHGASGSRWRALLRPTPPNAAPWSCARTIESPGAEVAHDGRSPPLGELQLHFDEPVRAVVVIGLQ